MRRRPSKAATNAPPVDTARVTVHCTSASCGWSTQRRRETALERPCLRCGAEVRLVDVGAGRPRLPEDQRRVLLRAWVLPATISWLDDLGLTPAEYLDESAARHRSG